MLFDENSQLTVSLIKLKQQEHNSAFFLLKSIFIKYNRTVNVLVVNCPTQSQDKEKSDRGDGKNTIRMKNLSALRG